MDSILSAHQIGERFFDFSQKLNGISIRDQMVRGQMFAESLPSYLRSFNETQPDAHVELARDVLVIGAGACGMTIAIGLAAQGLSVVVVEKRDDPFSLQANCASRWIDPTQYDWPLDHWQAATFPIFQRPPQSPPCFRWSADRSHRIVSQWWQPALSRYERRFDESQLSFYWGFEARSFDSDTNVIRAELVNANDDTQSAVPSDFRAVVLARGHGKERTTLDGSQEFRGYRFWETDPFENPDCGRDSTVVVSGTGDGALQDFLRILTRRKSVRDIYLALEDFGLNDHLNAIHSAEHRIERVLNWNLSQNVNDVYLNELHKLHENIAGTLAANDAMKSRLRELASDGPDKVVLVSPQAYFACMYPLNRLLTLLFIEGLRGEGRVELISNCKVNSISSNDAPDKPTSQSCVGVPWQVQLEDAEGAPAQSIEASVVILRHGLQRSSDNDFATQRLPAEVFVPQPAPPFHLQ